MWLSDFRQGVLYVHHHVGVHFFVGVASVSRVPAVNDHLARLRRIIHPLVQLHQVCDVIRPSIRAASLSPCLAASAYQYMRFYPTIFFTTPERAFLCSTLLDD